MAINRSAVYKRSKAKMRAKAQKEYDYAHRFDNQKENNSCIIGDYGGRISDLIQSDDKVVGQ